MKTLERYLDIYTDLLLDELSSASIIKPLGKDDSSGLPKYQLIDETRDQGLVKVSDGAKIKGVVQEFYDFRNILHNVFRALKLDHSRVSQSQKLSDILDVFIELKAFNPKWKNVSLLRDFIDKADDILIDEELKASTIDLLEQHKVSFNSLIMDVLKYNTQVNLNECFKDGSVAKYNSGKIKNNFVYPDFRISVPYNKSYILVEVKLRKARIVMKELIQQAIEVMRINNQRDLGLNKCLLIVYTYGNLGDIERDVYRFKQNMEANFGTYEKLIHFLSVGISSLDRLKDDLNNIKDDISDRNIWPLLLVNQETTKKHPASDDHFFDRTLDLKNTDVEIKFSTKNTGHWRFGVKFSRTASFPSKEQRHSIGYPIFHVQKEIVSHKLSATFYDDLQNGREFFTTIDNYRGEVLIIKITSTNDLIFLNVLDSAAHSIISKPIEVGIYQFCRIFAWADGRNTFDFEGEIIAQGH